MRELSTVLTTVSGSTGAFELKGEERSGVLRFTVPFAVLPFYGMTYIGQQGLGEEKVTHKGLVNRPAISQPCASSPPSSPAPLKVGLAGSGEALAHFVHQIHDVAAGAGFFTAEIGKPFCFLASSSASAALYASPPVGKWFSTGGGLGRNLKSRKRSAVVSHCPIYGSAILRDDLHSYAGSR